MKQYCRYCSFCFDADEFRCSNHPEGKELRMTRQQINRENHCPNFALSDLGDVETGRQYKPQQHRKTLTITDNLPEQETMWDYIEEIRIG